MATATINLADLASDLRDSVTDFVSEQSTEAERQAAVDFWASFGLANQFQARMAASKAASIDFRLSTAAELHNSGQVNTAAARRAVAKLVKEKLAFLATLGK